MDLRGFEEMKSGACRDVEALTAVLNHNPKFRH
jgi:hypothetical protein